MPTLLSNKQTFSHKHSPLFPTSYVCYGNLHYPSLSLIVEKSTTVMWKDSGPITNWATRGWRYWTCAIYVYMGTKTVPQVRSDVKNK